MGKAHNTYGEINIVTDLLKAFLGKGSVSRFQRATMEDVSQWNVEQERRRRRGKRRKYGRREGTEKRKDKLRRI
jgi:hypothetical protein